MTTRQTAQTPRSAQSMSRRNFGRMTALLAAGAALPFYNETALAQLSKIGPLPPDAVKINANENPLGPCPEAIEAISKVIAKGGRYLYEETDVFAKTLADQEGLDPEYILPFPGSSDPLHRAVLAYTSKEKPFITADPGYEAGARAAQFIGAKVVRVPLTPTHAHDVKAMVKAAHERKAGLIYICNPNNPTGTITPRADIEWVLANKPEETILLLDEAYIHLSDEPLASDLVAMDKDVIILRTFSKLYGMAGLRAGCAMATARPFRRRLPSRGRRAASCRMGRSRLTRCRHLAAMCPRRVTARSSSRSSRLSGERGELTPGLSCSSSASWPRRWRPPRPSRRCCRR